MSVTPIASMPVTGMSVTQGISDVSTSMRAFDTAPDGLFDSLMNQLETVNTQLVNTDKAVQRLASGETDNLHQVMISLEQTRIAFDLLLQVRNKVLDAYQEVMRMQV